MEHVLKKKGPESEKAYYKKLWDLLELQNTNKKEYLRERERIYLAYFDSVFDRIKYLRDYYEKMVEIVDEYMKTNYNRYNEIPEDYKDIMENNIFKERITHITSMNTGDNSKNKCFYCYNDVKINYVISSSKDVMGSF